MRSEELRMRTWRGSHFCRDALPRVLHAATLPSILPYTISGIELCQPIVVTVIHHHSSEGRNYDG